MKVLTFTSLYPNNIWPHHGVFIKERMTAFARLHGRFVKVVAPVPYFPPLKIGDRWRFSQVVHREMIEGVEVFHPRYWMTPKVGMSLYGVLMFLSVLPTVKRIQKTFDFDVIDAHFVYPDGFAAVLLGRFLGKPVVVSARGSDVNLYQGFPTIRRLLQYTFHRGNKIIAVCQALKDAIVQLDVEPEKILVIPNGVDAKKFYRVPREEARKILHLPEKKIILSIGGLVRRKGFDLLIKALKILFDKYHEDNLYLVIVGEGDARRELESLISSLKLTEYVYLAGDVAHQELYRWYSAANLFCLASSREGWPNVVLESLACGTPVVATNVWGAPEILCSDTVGLLTERNADEIAEKIFLALRKPWRPEAIRQYAVEHTWERAALSVCHVFESVTDTSHISRRLVAK